jgi:RNA polymerase sigma factor (TIGR02999 family)
MSRPGKVTELLRAWRQGDRAAEADLLPLVYGELRARAARALGRERSDHTLQPTALVHEAYLRLVGQEQVDWQDRAHFFAIAAKLMRQILIDHARRHGSAKRGGGREPVSLEVVGEVAGQAPAADLLALDEALTRLARFDPAAAQVVELRYFGGLTVEETAGALGRSASTVVRQWRAARAWLWDELGGSPPAGG